MRAPSTDGFAVRCIAALGLVAATGCITDVSSYQMPGAELDRKARMYVVIDASDERSRQVARLIVEGLALRGIEARGGPLEALPAETQVVVKYDCQWQWDMAWYLLDLRVGFYELPAELLIVSGHSTRTSLARASTETMVEEVMTEILDKETGA